MGLWQGYNRAITWYLNLCNPGYFECYIVKITGQDGAGIVYNTKYSWYKFWYNTLYSNMWNVQ